MRGGGLGLGVTEFAGIGLGMEESSEFGVHSEGYFKRYVINI